MHTPYVIVCYLRYAIYGMTRIFRIIMVYSGGCRKHNFWTARVKPTEIIILKSLCREQSIGIYIWVESGRGGWGGVVPGGVLVILRGVSNFFWAISTESKYIIRILSSSPVNCHPF
jgi:hypothetical protein